MSDFKVEVVRVGPLSKHPNADSLSLVQVFDYPVIVRTDDFHEGDLAVYVPVESVVPDTPDWEFLQGHRRIKAKRLRGTFSMGLLVKAPAGAIVGHDVAEQLGIVKYEEPPSLSFGGEDERDPQYMPVYTDIESFRRYHDVLLDAEEVVVTEKIHGANCRFTFRDDRLWVGSHKCIKREDRNNLFWRAAIVADLRNKLSLHPGLVLYGEVFGQVQDLKYGAGPGQIFFRAFDMFDPEKGSYLDWNEVESLAKQMDIPLVPVLYRSAWGGIKDGCFSSLCSGPSTIDGADNMLEGVVVKPIHERWDERVGRVILKLLSQEYLLRKHGTEYR